MTLAYPALAGRFLVNPNSDQYIAGYAFREFAAESLRSGNGFPLWNPYLFGGMPFVAAMHGDIFYPTFLLRMVLPTDVAMTWGFILHVVLAGLFTFGFLRAWGFSFGAALVGGLAYMLGGNLAGQVSPGHDGKMFVSALFPLICWLLLLGIRDGRRWAWGTLAIVIGLSVLSPHPQLLQYSLLGSGAFALLVAFGLGAQSPPRAVAVRRLALALGAVVLGGLMGAIQYLPVREYVSWSPRAGGVGGWETATSYSMPPEEMINFYLPHFSGLLDRYWGRNGIHFHSEYIGAAVLALVALAFGRTEDPRRRRWLWFWTAAFVVSLLWALGGFTPFYRIVYAIIPGTKFFRAPSTMLFLVSFTLAMLAALGVERVRAGAVTTTRVLAVAGAAALVSLLGLTGALGNLGATIVGPDRYESLADGGALALGSVRSLVFALLATGAALAAARGRVPPRGVAILLAGVVALDLWTVVRHYWRFIAPASLSFASDAAVEYVRRDTMPGRVLPFPVSNEMASHDPQMLGDGLMVHGIRNVRGYHGNELGRFTILGGRERGYDNLYTPMFARLYNVRYVLANGDLPAQFTRVAGPVRNAAGTTVSLYRVPDENPLAWVTPVIVAAPDEAVAATVLDPRFDPRTAALFDTSAAVQGQTITSLPTPLAIRASVPRYAPGAIDVVLDQPAPAGSALIVSENYYPGWSATADGRPATIGRADFTLIGVALPQGARRIELRFRSAPYERGKVITLIAIAAAIAWLVAGILSTRLRARAAGPNTRNPDSSSAPTDG